MLNENNISIAGDCKSPAEAVTELTNCKADIVVMDANWTNYGFSGGDILRKLLKFDETLKVIFVTNSYEDKLVESAKEYGARGYFYRSVNSVKAIVDCITNVYEGDNCFIDKMNFEKI